MCDHKGSLLFLKKKCCLSVSLQEWLHWEYACTFTVFDPIRYKLRIRSFWNVSKVQDNISMSAKSTLAMSTSTKTGLCDPIISYYMYGGKSVVNEPGGREV